MTALRHPSLGMRYGKPRSNGYGASKFVAEQACLLYSVYAYVLTRGYLTQMLAKAAENGLQCTSLILGQVCGSNSNGAWASNEWLPILVKSSVSLDVLPHLEGVRNNTCTLLDASCLHLGGVLTSRRCGSPCRRGYDHV